MVFSIKCFKMDPKRLKMDQKRLKNLVEMGGNPSPLMIKMNASAIYFCHYF